MKKRLKVVLAGLIVFAVIQGCEKNSISQELDSFDSWSNSLSLADVQAMYNSGESFMFDARYLSYTGPFSMKDSITNLGVDNEDMEYPYTNSEGLTKVSYRDSLIFQNSWNNYYMDPARSMTMVRFGELHNLQCLRITNQSHFPPNLEWSNGYYGTEHRFFIEKEGDFKELILKDYGVSYSLAEIKKSPREGVIILLSSDFPRSFPKFNYLILLDLCSENYKIFKFDHW